MAVYINIGEVIEGKTIDCTTRKWLWKGLKKHPVTQKRMTLYVTDRNSVASIIKAIDVSLEEEIMEKTKHFHRQIDDKLEADSLSVYVNKKQLITPNVKEGTSGRHGAQIIHITEHTIAEIKTPLETFKKLLGLSNNLKLE